MRCIASIVSGKTALLGIFSACYDKISGGSCATVIIQKGRVKRSSNQPRSRENITSSKPKELTWVELQQLKQIPSIAGWDSHSR